MYPTLTKRQKEILDYIKIFNEINGYAPSLVDIKNHFRLSAISTVHEHIQNLKEKGYIQKEMNQARSIRAIDSNIGNKEFVEIPILGNISKKDELHTSKQNKSILLHKEFTDNKGRYFAIRISNDAMEDHGIHDGDILVVKETEDVRENMGKLVIAKIAKDRVTVGQLVKENSQVAFQPLNTILRIKSYRMFSVQGKVVTLLRNYV